MNEDKTRDAIEKATEERKARRARYEELKAKIEENEAAIDRKRDAINEMHARYQHGMIDLTYFASQNALRDRASVERAALHRLTEELAVAHKDYSRSIGENNKLIDEANTLLKQIESEERHAWSDIGGILGGALSYVMGKAVTEVAKTPSPGGEPPP